MEKVNNFFLDNDFDKKIIEVRKLEAQKHHQNDMYAKPLQNKRKDRVEIEMKNYCKGKSFYDIGCAEGLFCDLAMSYGATRSKGVDVVEETEQLFKNFGDKYKLEMYFSGSPYTRTKIGKIIKEELGLLLFLHPLLLQFFCSCFSDL